MTEGVRWHCGLLRGCAFVYPAPVVAPRFLPIESTDPRHAHTVTVTAVRLLLSEYTANDLSHIISPAAEFVRSVRHHRNIILLLLSSLSFNPLNRQDPARAVLRFFAFLVKICSGLSYTRGVSNLGCYASLGCNALRTPS